MNTSDSAGKAPGEVIGKKEVETGELLTPSLIATDTGAQNPEKLQTLVREKFAKKREFVEGKLGEKVM